MSRLNKGAAEQRFPLPVLLQKLACVMAVALALVCAGAYAPTTAQALETAKITARPNTGSGSDVVGGTETRITWEVQADADEELSGLSLTFVDGTTFGTDDTRLTMLSGEDLMDRTPMKPTCKADGQTLKIDFGETAPAGGFFRVEVYGVTFPVEGGDEAFSGTYTLADGSTKKISKIPSVEIKGVTAFDNFLADLKEQPWVEAWNSNMFLRLFLNPVILVQSLPIVFKGFLMSLSIVLVAFPLAIPFGFALSLMRISKSRILRCLAGIYVNIIRGTPAFLQIYIAFFGLPLAGVKFDDYVLGVIVMAMNSSAYLCEIFRAGIQSIPKCKQRGRRHVLLVVVRKGNGNQNEERYNGKHHHAQHRQRQQRDIKFLIKVAVDVLTEAVGLFTGSLLLLEQVIRLHDHHGRHDQRDNDHHRNDAEQQNSKRVIVIVDLVFEGHRVELHLHLDSAERAKLF